ncbi:putative C6 transcription factor [Pleomassaria siparia CBS 279.74]|uniref:Putative C6 transcription factor n=1 Tax=Pleomassaria siparia CBS 279.74 TaxID=1314801 RepID=A0A6G1JZ59_9PLEO|nr:putative C6 transcription factor [Pleomassaria siparia CBS 279.74]
MPKRVPIPGTNILPDEVLPLEISPAESNVLCLRAFFYDYCFISTNPSLSKGYLVGLETLTYRLGIQSDLVKAPGLLQKADILYQELLGALAQTIRNPTSAKAAETRFVAMLLGLYQITNTDISGYGSHDLHAKGLAALMHCAPSPLSLFGNYQLASGSRNKINVMKSGILSVEALCHQEVGLDYLLLRLDVLWTKAEITVTLTDFFLLKADVMALEKQFLEWEYSRIPELKPTEIGTVPVSESHVLVGYWPGKIDIYYDVYVAAIWNVFRTTHLLLLALISKVSNNLGETLHTASVVEKANLIASDMLASVPYHLTDNLQAFVSELSNGAEITETGRCLGGLLLMHPLYVASELPFVEDRKREYMRDCLGWIGTNMGIGQASFLAATPGVGRRFLESGCMIIWSGFK